MERLGRVFGKEVDALLVKEYWPVLSWYGLEEISAAIDGAIAEETYFPRPATLRQYIASHSAPPTYTPEPSPPQTIEDIAGGIIASGFIKTIPAMQRASEKAGDKIDYEAEYNKYKKAHWADAMRDAARVAARR